MNFLVNCYLDACVATKLFVQEDGSAEIRDFVQRRYSIFCLITEFAFFEMLGVFKRKWMVDKILTEEKYFFAVSQVESYVSEGLLEIDDEFRVSERQLLLGLRELVQRYSVDYSDALQLYTVLHGRWRRCVDECKTTFVSADTKLVKAARNEGLRVWHFGKEAPPV